MCTGLRLRLPEHGPTHRGECNKGRGARADAAAQLCPQNAGPSPRAEGQIGNHSVCSRCRGQLTSPLLPVPAPTLALAPQRTWLLCRCLQGSQEKSPAVASAWLLLRHTLWGSCHAGRGTREARGALAWRSVSLGQWLPGSVKQINLDALTADSLPWAASPFRCSRCSRQSLGTRFSRVIFLGRVLCVLLPHTSAFFSFLS